MQRFQGNPDLYETVVSKVTQVLRSKPEILFAYLHGSFRGLSDFGDVDIAVYVGKKVIEQNLEYELNLEEELSKLISLPADVRIINKAPLAFCYNVIKNGEKLLDRAENLRVEFETKTFSSYFDFLPFRQRYLEEILNNEL